VPAVGTGAIMAKKKKKEKKPEEVIPFDPSIVGTHPFQTALKLGIERYENTDELIIIDIKKLRNKGFVPAF
jgi:hypothetical protein